MLLQQPYKTPALRPPIGFQSMSIWERENLGCVTIRAEHDNGRIYELAVSMQSWSDNPRQCLQALHRDVARDAA